MAFRAPSVVCGGADLSSCYGEHFSFSLLACGDGSWKARDDWNVLVESGEHGDLYMVFPDAVWVDLPYRWQRITLGLSAEPSLIRSRECHWLKDGHIASEEPGVDTLPMD